MTQHYGNHVHRPRVWLVTALLAVAGFVTMVLFVLRQPSLIAAGLLLLSMAVLGLVALARQYAMRLQDRIIRLEMRVRLATLGLEGQLARVSRAQLIALRFASDAELPELLRRAEAERLTPDQIKRAIRDWQADTMRT